MTNNKQTGTLEVITGSMYSSKTENLVSRLRVAGYAKKRVVAFKPANDTRYDANQITSHIGTKYPVITGYENDPEKMESEILSGIIQADVIGIEEAQFWHKLIVPVCDNLANKGYRVIVAGLDLDYLGQPFGPMPALMAIADTVTKLQAACTVCGDPANRTYRTTQNTELVDVGSTDKYEARCRYHFYINPKNNVEPKIHSNYPHQIANDLGLTACSFCGRHRNDTKALVQGPGISICDQCVEFSHQIISQP